MKRVTLEIPDCDNAGMPYDVPDAGETMFGLKVVAVADYPTGEPTFHTFLISLPHTAKRWTLGRMQRLFAAYNDGNLTPTVTPVSDEALDGVSQHSILGQHAAKRSLAARWPSSIPSTSDRTRITLEFDECARMTGEHIIRVLRGVAPLFHGNAWVVPTATTEAAPQRFDNGGGRVAHPLPGRARPQTAKRTETFEFDCDITSEIRVDVVSPSHKHVTITSRK